MDLFKEGKKFVINIYFCHIENFCDERKKNLSARTLTPHMIQLKFELKTALFLKSLIALILILTLKLILIIEIILFLHYKKKNECNELLVLNIKLI